ncbi:MAG: dihydroorotase [Firmicutes bacterium]|nr:dihydroorotase [Bacillota bacterium]
MKQKILIRGAHVIDPPQNLDAAADILICGDKIEAVGSFAAPPDCTVIHADGLVCAPGLVDMHVHLRDPGQTQKEDVLTGCRAAAAGGVTSLLAMPNTSPALDSPEIIRELLARAEQADARVYAAAAITKGLGGHEATDLQAVRDAGAIALSDDGRPVVDTRILAQAMCRAPQFGMTVTAHCEDLFLAAGGKMHEGSVSRALGVPGIPAAAEDAGTAREIAVAEAFGVPVHICHVSTAVSIAMIRDAKKRGAAVTAETCPHYFSFTDEALLSRDADFRMNPPLRTAADCSAVIEALFDGTLDAIATDHAPHTPQEKSDFLSAPNGSIGMETSLAASLTVLHHRHGMPLRKIISLMSCRPAQLLGIPAGTLAPGSNADLILFDPNRRWTVDPAALHGKSRNTPWKGVSLTGRVMLTVCRGKIVFSLL